MPMPNDVRYGSQEFEQWLETVPCPSVHLPVTVKAPRSSPALKPVAWSSG